MHILSRLSIATGLALGLCIPGIAAAQSVEPPASIVWLALSETNAARFDAYAIDDGASLARVPPPGMIRQVDISHDGVADWLLDFRAADSAAFCGTGGCTSILYVSGRDGTLVRALDIQGELTIGEYEAETRIEVEVHRVHCDTRAGVCRMAWAWDAESDRLVERVAGDGAGRLFQGGVSPRWPRDPRDLIAYPMPLGMVHLAEASTLGCMGLGTPDDRYVVRRPLVKDIPDIDGDGRRDWLLAEPWTCDDKEAPGFLIAVDRDPLTPIVFEAFQDAVAEIDVSTVPATVYSRPTCAAGGECPATRLAWNGPRLRLEPQPVD